MYYLDTDNDGLGYDAGGQTQMYCEEDVPQGWVSNADDEYPNCTSNEIDGCGVCDGDDSSCSGCTDSEAPNYDSDATIDDGSCIYTPIEFAFNQSTLQAFYFINTSEIRSTKFRPIFGFMYWFLVSDFLILGWIGQKPVESPYVEIGMAGTVFYFLFFLVLLPAIGIIEKFLIRYKD